MKKLQLAAAAAAAASLCPEHAKIFCLLFSSYHFFLFFGSRQKPGQDLADGSKLNATRLGKKMKFLEEENKNRSEKEEFSFVVVAVVAAVVPKEREISFESMIQLCHRQRGMSGMRHRECCMGVEVWGKRNGGMRNGE